MLIKFLVRTLKCAETVILYICFARKNMKNPPSKVRYFSKITEIVSTYCKKCPELPRHLKTVSHCSFNFFLYLVQIFAWVQGLHHHPHSDPRQAPECQLMVMNQKGLSNDLVTRVD